MPLLDWTLLIWLLWSPEDPPYAMRTRVESLRAALEGEEGRPQAAALATELEAFGRAAREPRLKLAAEAAAARAWAQLGQRDRAWKWPPRTRPECCAPAAACGRTRLRRVSTRLGSIWTTPRQPMPGW